MHRTTDSEYERMGFVDLATHRRYPHCFISPKSNVSPDAKIMAGAYIEENCVIGKQSRIGCHTVLRPETIIGDYTTRGHLCVCEGKTWIGNHVLIHAQSHITLGATIEDWVFMGPCSICVNDRDMLHGRRHVKKFEPQGPHIKFGARIATGAIITPGVTVGREAVVGAGAVVTKDIPDFTVAYGVPAVPVRKIDDKWRLPEKEYELFRKRVK